MHSQNRWVFFLRWPSVSHICAFLHLMSSSVVHQTIPLTLIWKLRIPVSPDVAHLNQFVQGGFFEACQIMSTKKVMQCQKSCFLAATVIINAKQSATCLSHEVTALKYKAEKKIALHPSFPAMHVSPYSNLVNGTVRCLRTLASTVLPSSYCASAVAIAKILILSHWRTSLKNNWIFHEVYK